MNWRVKGITQKLLGLVPGGVRLNAFLSNTLGEHRDFRQHVADKIRDWTNLVSYMAEAGCRPNGLRFLEIGTGWFPILPVCYSLAKAAKVDTFDLIRHLHSRRATQMVSLLQDHLPAIATAGCQSLEDTMEGYRRLQSAATVEEMFRLARITYHAPGDAIRTGLAAESVDVVFSNSVLEHVPGQAILQMMRESQRILRPGGLSIHGVNCGDHYAYFDRKITAINYLTYPEKKWRFWNNKMLYQNRLRPQDFESIAEEAGLEIVFKKQRPKGDLLAMLPALAIAPEFQHYSAEQLCCTSFDFVARKP
jgi:hypothetical protein